MREFEIEFGQEENKFELEFTPSSDITEIELENNTTEFELDFDKSPKEFEIEYEPSTEFEIDISNKVLEVYPELEDITITPSTEEQNFKSDKYGYGNVKVEVIPDEYIKAEVIEKTLVLSRVTVEEGGLIL